MTTPKSFIERYLEKQQYWFFLFALLSVIAPAMSFWACLMPEGESLAHWFQRSGALSVVLALRAEKHAGSMWEGLNPGGMVDAGFDDVRRKYFYRVRFYQLNAYFLIAFGTLVWGYGDLMVLFFS